jgi:hypothetical protein
VQGSEGPSETALAGAEGPLRDLAIATSGFRVHTAHELVRLEVHCPEGTFPLGGGMFTKRPIDPDGEGVYAHSYERLGVQSGFHITPTFVTPERHDLTPRRGELQVICGLGLVPTESPHETTFVRREGTGSVTARCPEGTQLFSGGFQRTNFTTPGITYGGNYITESRAVGTNAWTVSAGATDDDGGELTAIAHCAEDDSSLPFTEVSASTTVADGEPAAVATPPCPPGRALTAGGFSFGGSHDALFGEGYFTRDGRWAATAYGWFGSAELTAYGYCLEVADVSRVAFPPAPKVEPAAEVEEVEDDSSLFEDLKLPILAALMLAAIGIAGWVLSRRRGGA